MLAFNLCKVLWPRWCWYLPLILSVAEEGLTTKTGLTLNFYVELMYNLPHISKYV